MLGSFSNKSLRLSSDIEKSDLSITDVSDVSGVKGPSDANVPGNISGLQRFNSKKFFKGMAFTHKERQMWGIHGLLPFAVRTMQEQVDHSLAILDNLTTDLQKHTFLTNIRERNQRLFFNIILSDLLKMIPLIYTPTLTTACEKFSFLYYKPTGLFITIKDKGHIYDVLKNWPETDIRVICVTDGERILGLGDMGANGMCVPLGKMAMYTVLAGIKPFQCVPLMLDVGTNNKNLLSDEFYIGLRHKRVTGQKYLDFVDELMNAIVKRYGQNCLVHFEDFGRENSSLLISKYKNSYCVYNDDIQGTATVALAGLLAAMKTVKSRLSKNTILFMGAGEAALGIADLLVTALKGEGLTEQEARKRIWMVDSRGLIIKNRPKGGLSEHKKKYAQPHEPVNCLAEAVKIVKPSILIGASAVKGAFTEDILMQMAQFNESPIILALSNPASKCECTAKEAYIATRGKCIFASGSTYTSVKFAGKKYHPGQAHNTCVFPGLIMGILCSEMNIIPDELFVAVAESIANSIHPDELVKGNLYPHRSELNSIALLVAESVMKFAFKHGWATLRPEPKNRMSYIKSQMYDFEYTDTVPKTFAINYDEPNFSD